MDHVAHDGRTTAYRQVGNADALCVHGSGGTHAVWRGQFRLAGGVAAHDLSGHGDSEDVDVPPGDATIRAYVDDVRTVAHETDASVLVGTSLGGAVALSAVLDGAVDPDALVLAGVGARLLVLPDLLDWLRDDFERAVEFLHGPNRLFHDVGERVVDRSRDAMRAVGREVTYRDFATCDAFDVRDRLGEIDVPALVIAGDHDKLTPPAMHDRLADGLPRGERTTIADAAHLSMLERQTAFNDAIEGFLDGLD